MVLLVESGFAQSGMVGLGREEGWRRGRRRVSGKRLRSIARLKSEGSSNRAIAQRLGVNEKAIRKLVGPSTCGEVEQLALATMPNTPARRHPAMPATTDHWLNDRTGDPLLVITGDVNAALTKAFPNLLREVRGVIGERRATIVLDRGGWSPKLFHTMIEDGFDILTFRKGRGRLINQRRFVHRRAKLDGRWVSYDPHDQPVRFLKGKRRLRQVTRLCDNGHQTRVITNRWDLRDIEVACRMFDRWRQENFFKYMREEFLLDALVDYRIEPEDSTRTIPNPERRALDKQIRAARAELATERKHPTDIVKMVAYQVESDLLASLQPHYARAEQEGRTLLHEPFAAAGDIRVCDSELRIRFAVRPPPRLGLAFPGSPVQRSTVPVAASAP